MTLLRDEEWGQWSNSEIARQCRVSAPYVLKLRDGLTCNITSDQPRTYTTTHGTTAVMQTANIGKASQPASNPEPKDAAEAISAGYSFRLILTCVSAIS